MRKAVIGIDSNSVRMLLAEVEGDSGKRLMRDRAATRLFAGLDEQRRLSQSAMRATAEAAAAMAGHARELGAESVQLFATSATRDAVNSDAFSALLLQLVGVPLHICSGDEEAALSFLGATDGGDCGVIDIGGGSTEVVLGEGEQLRTAFSCQIGAVRLFRRFPIERHEDMAAVQAEAEARLRQQIDACGPLRFPAAWRGTGGTFTTLAAMVKNIPWTMRTDMHGTVLEQRTVADWGRLLADMPMEQRLRLPGIQPARADIVVHGICILLACMECLDIPAVTVSECGNLEGYLKRSCGLRLLL